MKNEIIRVAGVQLPHIEGTRDSRIISAVRAIESAGEHDIYVLPELSSSGYNVQVFNMLPELAEDINGPSFSAFSALAKKKRCFICYSFPKRVQRDAYTISTAVVDRSGKLVASYDKLHVCSVGLCCEKDYFATGREPVASFDIDGLKVGLAICYDIRFPELTRTLTLEHGISLLLHPGGWPKDECFDSWHTFVQVRAMENQIYIMSTNWAGEENGSTVFCPPFVDGQKHRMEKLADDPGVLSGVVDLHYLKKIRTQYPYLLDRSSRL